MSECTREQLMRCRCRTFVWNSNDIQAGNLTGGENDIKQRQSVKIKGDIQDHSKLTPDRVA